MLMILMLIQFYYIKNNTKIFQFITFYTKKIMDAKSLGIRFDKVEGIIKIYDGSRYLKLSDSYNEVFYWINSITYNAIFYRINYLISKKGVLQSVLIIILEESELIHVILYL